MQRRTIPLAAMIMACIDAAAQHIAQAGGGKRSERLECNRQVGAYLKRDVENSPSAVKVCLGDLPRLGIGNIFIPHPRYRHSIFESVAEPVPFIVLLHRRTQVRNLRNRVLVNLPQTSADRDISLEEFVCHPHCAAHKVAEYRHKLAVVAGLEIFPAEIIVLCLRSVRCEHIPQHILLAGEIIQVLVSPDSPVPGSGDLVTLEIEEFICRDILGKDIAVAVCLKHGREHDTMKYYVVLAYEMHKAGVGRLPPLLPVIRKEFLSVGDIPDRSIEPNIKHLTCSLFKRNRDAPVQVARHRTRLKASVQPALDLSIDIRTPVLMAFENPFSQPFLIVLERQIPVPGLLLYWLGAAELALRVDQLVRAEGAAALLALVAVCSFVPAFRTGADYVAVCQECLGFGIIVLLALF